MSSVTQRISKIKQPKGGYVKPSEFDIHKIDDGRVLAENENIHASLIGLAVDYLTRFAMGAPLLEAFKISCEGAFIAGMYFKQRNAIKKVDQLLSGIKTIDDAVINACKLVTYDVWRRNLPAAITAKGPDEINPNEETIHNIKIMVQRSIEFWENYGPIIKDGFTFGPNGYTETVDSGDGDFLTADTLWDFKVSKLKPTNKHTLQVLMYWIMGQHSGQEIYKGVHKLGIFNPRLNEVYLLNVDAISKEIIEEVEKDVICY